MLAPDAPSLPQPDTDEPQPRRARGRPPLPADRRLSVSLAPVKVTQAQAARWAQLGGPTWLRRQLDAAECDETHAQRERAPL